ncbi:MAG: spore maturation protein [Bacteroidota bacterium]|nr:spore maturation protein [Bacteroidota bacterium]
MALNYIWIGFFLIAFVVAIIKAVFFGDIEIFARIYNTTYETSKTGFEISLGLTAVMTLWLGLMKIGEKGGLVSILSRLVGPFFSKLFPEIPKNHPAIAPMIMNISANMLGLDNAATPLGLKAMHEMQELNPNKDTASNAQILFLVLNTSGLTIIPISIMVYRAQLGAVDPSDVFIPILLATYFSTMAGLISVAIFQRLNLFNRVVLSYLGALTLFIISIIWYFSTLTQDQIRVISSAASNFFIFSIIIIFILLAVRKGENVFEAFIEGGKEGFIVAIKIIPYLIAILVAIGVFRACGALDLIIQGVSYLVSVAGLDTQFIPALPTAFMKPLSGSGARGMMIDTMTQYGVDSFAGRLASVLQGSTETTFYVLAVYFGAVNIKNSRYAVTCGLIADLAGIIAAILLTYLFFA